MSYHDDFELYCPDPYDDFSEMQRRQAVKNEAKEGFWTTKDGTVIHVSKMTTSHIRNTINFIKRKDFDDSYLPWILRFERELKDRGEVVEE